MELLVIRRFYGRPPEDQILVTFGLGIVVVELVRLRLRQPVEDRPAALLGSRRHPDGLHDLPDLPHRRRRHRRRRAGGLYIVLYRTRLGMIVRAGIEDSGMVDLLGINVYRVFMLVFGIGATAAGFAGIVNAPVVSLTPDMGESILVQTFVVVVIGGVGSFPGAVVGGLIAGEILSLTSMVDPAYSAGHAVRGHDPRAAAAAAGPARRHRPRMRAIALLRADRCWSRR